MMRRVGMSHAGNRVVKSIGFNRKNVSCELYDVNILKGYGGDYQVPAAQISTGPGTGPPDARPS